MESRQEIKYRRVICITIFLLILAIFTSVFIGRYKINFEDTITLIIGKNADSLLDTESSILFNLRIPRIIMTVLVGASLSIAGVTLQGILGNPLASPDILGTSSAAGFGAALGILICPESFFAISAMSFLFGLLSVFLVFGLCKLKGDESVLSIVLSGIITSSIFIAFTAIIKYTADTQDTLPAITFWLMGSFAYISKSQLIYAVPILLSSIMSIYFLRWKLNLLSLGDDEAKLLGVNPKRLKSILLFISSILISMSVTVSGVVGWVGLVIPHLTRRIIGYNHGKLVPTSGIIGALFLLVIDDIARSIGFSEIPIGILTALIGAPIFAFLFVLGGKK